MVEAGRSGRKVKATKVTSRNKEVCFQLPPGRVEPYREGLRPSTALLGVGCGWAAGPGQAACEESTRPTLPNAGLM